MVDDPSAITPTDAPTTGWSAKLLVFALVVLGGLPTSGLLDNYPGVLKFLGLVMSSLAAVGYLGHQSAIKAVHAAGERRVQFARAYAAKAPPTDT